MIGRTGTHNESTRDEWLGRVLSQVPPGSRILDAGAGELKYRPLCSHLSYVSQDFAQYDGTGDASGLQMGSWDQSRIDIVCDITAIPEPDASFDAIMCIEVLEHLPDPLRALAEFSRLLRPGGWLILSAPFCSLTHFAPFHFHSGFSRYFYETHLPAAGFNILELERNGNFFEFIAQELRRVPLVARRYTASRLRPWEYLAVNLLLPALGRLSRRDRGSADLLCFGCQVLAVRREGL